MTPPSPPAVNSNFSKAPETAARNATKLQARSGSGFPGAASRRKTAPNAASTATAPTRSGNCGSPSPTAFETRPALLPERSECAVEHPGYPLWLARVLDLFAVENWEIKPVAARLGCSPSMLVKKLARDPELWKFTSDARRESGFRRCGRTETPCNLYFASCKPALEKVYYKNSQKHVWSAAFRRVAGAAGIRENNRRVPIMEIYNFAAGPAMLPKEVMQKAQAEFCNYQNSGSGVLELSHRGKFFQPVIDRAEANVRELLGALR